MSGEGRFGMMVFEWVNGRENMKRTPPEQTVPTPIAAMQLMGNFFAAHDGFGNISRIICYDLDTNTHQWEMIIK